MKMQLGSRAVRRHISWLMILVCLGFALDSISLAFAQVGAPAVINYQGRLYDPTAPGGPLTGVQQVQFRIYDSLAGGSLIWGRQFPVSCTAEGIFNVLVNDGGTALPDAATNQLPGAFLGKDRYLELTVVGHGEAISPRQQLVSAPYALQSAYAVDASSATRGFTVTGNLTVTNGSTIMHGATTFSGDTTFNGVVTMTNNLSVSEPATIAGYGTIPIGGVILWSGASTEIPDGWALCDGAISNGHATPDLRDRFVVGAGGEYSVSATGGQDTVTLTVAQMPAHDLSNGAFKFLLENDGQNTYEGKDDATAAEPNLKNKGQIASQGGGNSTRTARPITPCATSCA